MGQELKSLAHIVLFLHLLVEYFVAVGGEGGADGFDVGGVAGLDFHADGAAVDL